MDTLKKEIAILRQCSDFKEIEKQLQTINKLIVTNYMFELSNGLRIYPIEVEAYFKDSKFNDESVHGNELQKNNYGRFYVHRTGKTEDSKIKGGTRGGVDICLSDDVVYQTRARGNFRKKGQTPYVGDFVEFSAEENSEGYILKIGQRINSLVRPPIVNIDQAVVI